MFSINFFPVLFSSFLLSDASVMKMSGISLCKDMCKFHAGCTSVCYDSHLLRCELIYGPGQICSTEENGIKRFEVQHENSTTGCRQDEKIVHRRSGMMKCVEVAPKTIYTGRKKKEESSTNKGNVSPDIVNAEDEQSWCIPHKQENLTYEMDNDDVSLPIKVVAGMKITVYGSYVKRHKTSMFSMTTRPDKPQIFLYWMQIRPNWEKRNLQILYGFSTTTYKGDFPISDPAHFTIAFELTKSDTKVYVDNVFVHSGKSAPYVDFVVIGRFSQAYLLVVQRLDDRCDGVDSGLP